MTTDPNGSPTMPGPNAAMLVTDLIAALEDIVTEHGDTATVGAAHQPAYPIRLDVVGIATTSDLSDDVVIPEDALPLEGPADAAAVRQRAEAELPTVWLVLDQPNAHDVNPYAPAALWEVMSPVA